MNQNEPLLPLDVTTTGDLSPTTGQPGRNRGPRAGVGGTWSHSPQCKCPPCASRRRKEEAVTLAAGVGGIQSVETPNSLKVKTTKAGVRKPAPKPIRERLAQYLHYSMLSPNASKMEIAEKMGINSKRLYEILKEAKEENLISFSDPLDRVEYELIPKVVDNLNFFLDAKDKTVTIEAAKGTLFRAYQESKGLSDTNSTMLALKIELPDGHTANVLTGHIVGRPKGLPTTVINLDPSHES